VLQLEDCMITTGDMQTLWHLPDYQDIMLRLQGEFMDLLYVELVPINTPLYDRLNRIAIDEAERYE